METVIRVLLIYVFVLFGLRILGKRAFGELSPADLIVLMLIPEFFQQAVAREDFSLTNAFVAVSTLLTLVFTTTLLSYLFPRFGSILTGKPTTIAAHGYLRTDRMDRERVPPEEVLDAMQRSGLETMDQVKWAVLYPDGAIAVVPWRLPEPGREQQESPQPL